jgi:hypothetical protein
MSALSVAVPALDIDAQMLAQFGKSVSTKGKLERRIVANLIAHLAARGFVIREVDDYQELHRVQGVKAAMELVFDLDGCNLHFHETATGKMRCLVLVLGNGTDILADYFAHQGDAFDLALAEFDAETFA